MLLLFTLFVYRPPKQVTVNCWFCNQNTRVPFGNRNCFNCPHCDQYNGFDQVSHVQGRDSIKTRSQKKLAICSKCGGEKEISEVKYSFICYYQYV